MVCIACSVLKAEIEALRERGLFDLPTHFLVSNLHMEPEKLHERMVSLLEDLGRGRQVLLIYGDCHPYMKDLAGNPGVTCVKGQNCGEILLGRERYRQLLKEGAFFLFPEWTLRWREIFHQIKDIGKESTVAVMRERQSKLVYLDTGVCPVPVEELMACSEYFGLPYEVLEVSLDHLHSVINAAIGKGKSS